MISARISRSLYILILCAACTGFVQGQTLTMVSGNGQLIATQSLSNSPMVVQAKDASGRPAPNVAITWAITQGSGTINGAGATTDANGQASANFLSTSLQPGASFLPATVTASSAYGTVSFFITTVVTASLQPEVSIQVISPTLDNPTLTAASGSTIPAGLVVQVVVAGGAFSGSPIPNVGVQVVDSEDPSTPAAASCASPTGVVLTNSSGMATCDLVISGAPGAYQLRASVGSVQYTRGFSLTITPGQNCNYSLSASSQSVGAAGGTGAVNVITSSGCGWSAASNSGFIALTSAASATGSGSVSYVVAANSGAARSGTLTIARQTYTVNQSAAGGGPPSTLTISPPTLPDGTVGTSYQIMLTANGGTPPYTWSPVGSISTSGLSFQANGNLTGIPATAGTYPFTATVHDIAGATKTQSYTIIVNGTSTPPSGFSITNTSFPNGVVGQSYPSQLLTALGGCVTPFSPQPSFTVNSGALPVGLSIQINSDGTHSIGGTAAAAGSSTFTLLATDPCGKTATASFTITITGTPTSVQMLVSPASLSFTVQAGVANAPANQTLAISSNSGAVSYTAAVSSTSGNWLVGTGASSGTTPGSFTVGVANFAGLASGTYNGSITITSSASNSPLVVPVSLTVLAATPLTISPSSITVNETVSSSSPISQQPITVASGTTPVQFTASPTTNSGGTWLVLSPTQGSTPATLTAIINAQGLAVGQYIGTITILPATGAAQTITITLNVAAPATLSATPAPLAFSYQQAGSLPGAQSVAVNSSGAPLSVSISAATQTGGTWLLVSPPNGSTTVSLSVSVSPIGLSPGSYSGAITITPSDASVAALAIPVSLTVTQSGPSVAAATNAASYAPGPVAPGEIVTIFGTGMGPSTLVPLHVTDSGTLDTNLGGTQVFFDGYPAPLIYSSATAVSAIVPYEIAGTPSTSILIEYQGTRSNRMTVPVLDSLPGIFTAGALGYGQGAIINQDSSINSSQNGADPGSVVSIYATGAGQTDPASVDGTIADRALLTQLPVSVQIAGEPAELLYAGAAPGEPSGVLQVNARIPADVPRGTNVAVVITVGAVSSQAGVTVAIKP